MNKETKIPFFTSLTNSSLVKHLAQENLKTHVSFAEKQHQTSYRKEKTEITILSQETTNIKKYLKKKKLKSQSSRNNKVSVDPKKKPISQETININTSKKKNISQKNNNISTSKKKKTHKNIWENIKFF